MLLLIVPVAPACDAPTTLPSSLVRVTEEPAGANCTYGGVAIGSGEDADGSGALSADEVRATAYVCASADAGPPLVRVELEPSGADCSAGGHAILSGSDADRDGTLDESEIASTTFVCAPEAETVVRGSFVVRNSLDAAKLVGVTGISGDLTIEAAGLESIDLSHLTTVGGTVELRAIDADVVEMRSLTSIGGRLTVQALSPVGLDLPALTDVGAQVFLNNATTVFDAPALVTIGSEFVMYGGTSIDLSSLEHVGTNVYLTSLGAEATTVVDLPALASIGGTLQVANCKALTSISLPQLTSIGGALTLNGNTALTTFAVPDLASVGGDVQVSGSNLPELALSSMGSVGGTLLIQDNPAMATFLAPTLTAVEEYLSFSSNAALTAIALPQLVSVGRSFVVSWNPLLTSIDAAELRFVEVNFSVSSNPSYPTCRAQALVDQLESTPTINVSYGNSSASCP